MVDLVEGECYNQREMDVLEGAVEGPEIGNQLELLPLLQQLEFDFYSYITCAIYGLLKHIPCSSPAPVLGCFGGAGLEGGGGLDGECSE